MTTPSQAPSRRVELMTQKIIEHMVLLGDSQGLCRFTAYGPDFTNPILFPYRKHLQTFTTEEWKQLHDAIAALDWEVLMQNEADTGWHTVLLVGYPGSVVRP